VTKLPLIDTCKTLVAIRYFCHLPNPRSDLTDFSARKGSSRSALYPHTPYLYSVSCFVPTSHSQASNCRGDAISRHGSFSQMNSRDKPATKLRGPVDATNHCAGSRRCMSTSHTRHRGPNGPIGNRQNPSSPSFSRVRPGPRTRKSSAAAEGDIRARTREMPFFFISA
jgi:hypothetical protein